MSLAFAPGETTLDLVEVRAWNESVVQRSRTEFSRFFIRPEIRQVLVRWDDDSTGSDSGSSEFPENAIEAVSFIAEKLGVAQDEVLSAAGIKERTFFGWREGHQPRAASLGELWPMVQVVGRLSTVHPHLPAWFQSSEAAREAFAIGDVNALVVAELDWAVRNLTVAMPYVPANGDVTIETTSGWAPVESEDLTETDIGSLLITDHGIQ